MTQGETGLLPLIESGRVPPVDHVPHDFQTWSTLLAAVRELRDTPHDFRTLVIDTGNGAEGLCAVAVCDHQFGGTWADYFAYGRGNERAAEEWARFLALLDEVRLPVPSTRASGAPGVGYRWPESLVSTCPVCGTSVPPPRRV